ncbi:MAG: hypothetical protein COA57_05165 [Flavobacteriales bacterium]|nr:MAG: hypothetical protein COA57_05165 [Flavobacteriales bacterium]
MAWVISLIVLMIGLESCGKKQLKPMQYINYVENDNNGLKVVRKMGDYVLTAQYEPYKYLALKELKKTNMTLPEINEKVNQMGSLQYFTVKMSHRDGGDFMKRNAAHGQYNKKVQYLSFGIKNDFKLLYDMDTLECVLHHFERTYGVSPYVTFVLGFGNDSGSRKSDSRDLKGNLVLIYDDQLLGIGPIRFSVKKEAIEGMPELMLN